MDNQVSIILCINLYKVKDMMFIEKYGLNENFLKRFFIFVIKAKNAG